MVGNVNWKMRQKPCKKVATINEKEMKMQAKRLLKYKKLFLKWLEQYHRTHLKDGDVLHKLQYLKDRLTEYDIGDSTKNQLVKAA